MTLDLLSESCKLVLGLKSLEPKRDSSSDSDDANGSPSCWSSYLNCGVSLLSSFRNGSFGFSFFVAGIGGGLCLGFTGRGTDVVKGSSTSLVGFLNGSGELVAANGSSFSCAGANPNGSVVGLDPNGSLDEGFVPNGSSMPLLVFSPNGSADLDDLDPNGSFGASEFFSSNGSSDLPDEALKGSSLVLLDLLPNGSPSLLEANGSFEEGLVLNGSSLTLVSPNGSPVLLTANGSPDDGLVPNGSSLALLDLSPNGSPEDLVANGSSVFGFVPNGSLEGLVSYALSGVEGFEVNGSVGVCIEKGSEAFPTSGGFSPKMSVTLRCF